MIVRNNNRRRTAPNRQATEQQQSNTIIEQHAHDPTSRKTKPTEPHHTAVDKVGSRFSPIADIPEESNDSQIDQMTNELRNIKDSGPPVKFKATTKEQLVKTREKRGKGVPVRDPPRAKIQLPRGSNRSNQRQDPVKASPAHPARNDNFTWQAHDWPILLQSHSTAMQGTKPLKDITNNKTDSQKTQTQHSGGKDTIMDIHIEEEEHGHIGDQTKQKPPDNNYIDLENAPTECMEAIESMDADACRLQCPDMDQFTHQSTC